MSRILHILCLAFLMVGCTTQIKRAQPPKDLIQREQMVSLMQDLILTESHLELSYGQINKFYKILNTSSDAIFKKHHISRDRYDRSFTYYASDQDEMSSLYQEILDNLNIEGNIQK
ncbi:MAG: DUF4296 domain-containing protein [Crocinitomicaceae bacterium]